MGIVFFRATSSCLWSWYLRKVPQTSVREWTFSHFMRLQWANTTVWGAANTVQQLPVTWFWEEFFWRTAILSLTVASSIQLLLPDICKEVLLSNLMLLVVLQQPCHYPSLDLCMLFLCTWGGFLCCSAACSIFNNLAWISDSCSEAFLWLLQYELLRLDMDCGKS